MKARLCAIFVCMFAIAIIAQSVDGKWTGEVQGGRGGENPIQEGTISGTALKFKTQQQGRGGGDPVTLNWTGTLKGDEIAMSRMAEGGQGQAQEFVLKREK